MNEFAFEGGEDDEPEDDDFTLPFSALRQPTNMELAQLVGLVAHDLFANLVSVLKNNDLMAGDDEKQGAFEAGIYSSAAVMGWWQNLVEDPEYLNIMNQEPKDDE